MVYRALLGSDDLGLAIASFGDSDARRKHAEYVRAAQQREAASNANTGWFIAALGIVSVVAGLGLGRGFGILVLGGPVLMIFGVLIALRAGKRRRAAAAAQNQACDSPQAACERFYRAMLVPPYAGGTGATGEEALLAVAEVFPMPILEIYETRGWDMFSPPSDSRSTNSGELSAIECVTCGRRHESVKKHFDDTLLYSKPATKDKQDKVFQELDNSCFVRCRHCSSAFCLDDICYNVALTARYVCPRCNKSRGGWKALASRWRACQQQLFGGSRRALVSLSVTEAGPAPPTKSTQIVVTAVFPSGETAVFHNTAVRDDRGWYLLSPEPGIVN